MGFLHLEIPSQQLSRRWIARPQATRNRPCPQCKSSAEKRYFIHPDWESQYFRSGSNAACTRWSWLSTTAALVERTRLLSRIVFYVGGVNVPRLRSRSLLSEQKRRPWLSNSLPTCNRFLNGSYSLVSLHFHNLLSVFNCFLYRLKIDAVDGELLAFSSLFQTGPSGLNSHQNRGVVVVVAKTGALLSDAKGRFDVIVHRGR